MIIARILVVLLFLFGSVEATERFVTNNGLTSGTCTTSGTACRMDRALGLSVAGDIVTMLDGTYQGANNMLDIANFALGVSGSAGNVITVRAQNDGGVFIDGQFARSPITISGQSYWTLSGFDAGNGNSSSSFAASVINWFGVNHHITIQRVCLSNYGITTSNSPLGPNNAHVMPNDESHDNLYEDVCAFGLGRTVITDFGGNSYNNTWRRVWLRFEGAPPSWSGTSPTPSFYGDTSAHWCPGTPVLQYGYSTTSGSDIYEDIITIHDPEQYDGSWPVLSCDTGVGYSPASYRRSAGPPYSLRGWISYGYDGFTSAGRTQMASGDYWFIDPYGQTSIVDYFLDSRSQASTGHAFGFDCSGCSVDRLTSVRRSGGFDAEIGGGVTQSNINNCTATGSCPNFYTGSSPGTGARNCFRYVDGTLTSTPKWPWPMDDRIKAALARANAAGRGGSALAGAAGSGYAANTVTSEIVSRYGSVPTACLSGSAFTPSFPVASDFPSVTVRDDFNRANSGTLGAGWTSLLSDVFSIVSNAAAAPTTGIAFGRSVYTDTKLQTSHEVYATWTTLAVTGTATSFLSFAGTDLTENNQYRVRVNRTSSANTLVRVGRVDGAGTETTILSDVDLGIEAVDGNSFGVRVSGTTISVYWKWTDGIWYRVGQFTDANLSSLPSTGVYGGIAGSSPSVIDNFGAGPFVDQPAQSPPTPPASVGVGRFGTTFPGRR